MNRAELGRSLNMKVELIANGRGNRPGTQIRPRSLTVHNTAKRGLARRCDGALALRPQHRLLHPTVRQTELGILALLRR